MGTRKEPNVWHLVSGRLVLLALAAVVLAAGLGEFRRQAVEKERLRASVERFERQAELHSRIADSLVRTIKVREGDFNGQSARYERLRAAYRAKQPGPTLGDDYEIDEVEEILEAADTAVRTCRSLVRDCTLAISAKDRVIAAQDSTIQAIEALRPSPTKQFMETVLKVGIGIGIGYIVRGGL